MRNENDKFNQTPLNAELGKMFSIFIMGTGQEGKEQI